MYLPDWTKHIQCSLEPSIYSCAYPRRWLEVPVETCGIPLACTWAIISAMDLSLDEERLMKKGAMMACRSSLVQQNTDISEYNSIPKPGTHMTI